MLVAETAPNAPNGNQINRSLQLGQDLIFIVFLGSPTETAENLYQAHVSIQELRVNDIVDRLRSRHMRRLLEEHYQVLLGYKVIGRRGLVNDREESARGKKE